LKAIECAIKIQLKVKGLNEALINEGFSPIDVGVGIASGNALAGNIGTSEHMNYTVIGNPSTWRRGSNQSLPMERL